MWTEKAWSQACFSSRGGELVGGSKHGGLLLQEDNVKFFWGGGAAKLSVRAKVALGESGRQAPLLLDAGGESAGLETSGVGCLEFAERVENVDRSPTKAAGLGTKHKGRVVVIAGPTAVGKSRVAIALAKQVGGEIISADSIQVAPLTRSHIISVCDRLINSQSSLSQSRILQRSSERAHELDTTQLLNYLNKIGHRRRMVTM